jgi:hypothetical protein
MKMTKNGWFQGVDPRKMVRFLKRYPEFRPTTRKQILFACACSRSIWDRITSPKARELVEHYERGADDMASYMDKINATFREVAWELEIPANAVALACKAMKAMDAALTVPGVTPASLCFLVREIFGSPFRQVKIDPDWLSWNGGTVRAASLSIYQDSAFDQLPVLADALEDAGCNDAHLLTHLRSSGPHYRGCWALDELLGRTWEDLQPPVATTPA